MTAISSAFRDIGTAIEEGRFAVETPGVHVEQTDLQGLHIAVSNNPHRQHWKNGELVPGPTTLDLSFDYRDDYDAPHLYQELEAHAKSRYVDWDPLVLYGDAVMWYVDDLWDFNLTYQQVYDEHAALQGDVKFKWKTVEIAGPR